MKYKPLLIAATIITALWLLRCVIAGSLSFYGFIVGNILLATIPLLLEPLFPWIKKHAVGLVSKIARLFVGVTWLLFLPNTFYILTDFMHLNTAVLVNERDDLYDSAVYYARGDGLYVVDSLLLLAATLYGAYIGGLALLHAYNYFKRHMPYIVALLSLEVIMVLVAIGVYIGRYGRWNSWEGLQHPWAIITDLMNSLSDPAIRHRFLIIVLTLLIFQFLCILYIRSTQKTLK